MAELQILDLKKRIDELTAKCEEYKKQVAKLHSEQ